MGMAFNNMVHMSEVTLSYLAPDEVVTHLYVGQLREPTEVGILLFLVGNLFQYLEESH